MTSSSWRRRYCPRHRFARRATGESMCPSSLRRDRETERSPSCFERAPLVAGTRLRETPSPSFATLAAQPNFARCRPLLPQALMFDEAYSSHQFYQFEKFRAWFKDADAFVFVGTSFAVTVTDLAIKEAKRRRVPVFNFNLEAGRLEPTVSLNVENVIGKSEETLVQLAEALEEVRRGARGRGGRAKSPRI